MKYLKKSIALLLIIVMLFNVFDVGVIKVNANNNMNSNSTGGGNSGGTSGGNLNWSKFKQGYRFTLVDRLGRKVSRSIDILRDNVDLPILGGSAFYTGYRGDSGDQSGNHWDFYKTGEIVNGNIFKRDDNIWAIDYKGDDFYANGYAFFKYFYIDGKAEHDYTANNFRIPRESSGTQIAHNGNGGKGKGNNHRDVGKNADKLYGKARDIYIRYYEKYKKISKDAIWRNMDKTGFTEEEVSKAKKMFYDWKYKGGSKPIEQDIHDPSKPHMDRAGVFGISNIGLLSTVSLSSFILNSSSSNKGVDSETDVYWKFFDYKKDGDLLFKPVTDVKVILGKDWYKVKRAAWEVFIKEKGLSISPNSHPGKLNKDNFLLLNEWRIYSTNIYERLIKDPSDLGKDGIYGKYLTEKKVSIGSITDYYNDQNNERAKLRASGDTSEKNLPISAQELIYKFDLAVYVEPVYWFTPARWVSKGNYKFYNEHFYGTTANLMEFYKGKGANFGGVSSVSAYNIMAGKLAWKALYSKDNHAYYRGLNVERGKLPVRIELSEVIDRLNNKQAIAMHIYQLDLIEWKDDTSTWDEKGKPNEPGPSEEIPKDKKEPVPINIVKIYTIEDKRVTPSEYSTKTFLREETISKINIENESLGGSDLWRGEWTATHAAISKNGDVTELRKLVGEEKGRDKYEEVINSEKSIGNITNEFFGTGYVHLNADENENFVDKGEKTLYVKLYKKIDGTVRIPQPNGGAVLEESELSRAFSQESLGVKRKYDLSAPEVAATHTVTCDSHKDSNDKEIDCPGHTCTRSIPEGAKYLFDFSNKETIDKLLLGDARSGFSTIYSREDSDTEGAFVLPKQDKTVNSFNAEFVLHRGYDPVTISEYINSNGKASGKELADSRSGVVPKATREKSNYNKKLVMDLQIDSGKSKLSTSISHSYDTTNNETKTFTTTDVPKVEVDVLVKVYSGKKGVVGDETKNGLLNVPIDGMYDYKGRMLQLNKELKFYPYIQMTYEKTKDYGKKEKVHVLGEHLRRLLPNDYAEFGWRANNVNESMIVQSQQWSLHRKATTGSDGWQGANQVLPGGAIYNLVVNENEMPLVTVNTWQTVIEGPSRSIIEANGRLGDEYSVSKGKLEHKKYVDSVVKTLEGLNVEQFVNPNVRANKAWSAGGVKVGSGMSLNGLDGKNASTEDKYYLNDDPTGVNGSAGEGDIDLRKVSENEFYYKVYSDIAGNVYLAKSSDINILKGMSSLGSGNNVEKLFGKDIKWQDVNNRLSGIAKEIDDRTLLITNYVKAIERNTGNDTTASWVSDGKWYNEAFEGVYIMFSTTKFNIGFINTPLRSAALDPNLTPKNLGQADLYSKAYLSQFRLKNMSSTSGVQQYGENYVGHFKGQPVYANDLANMLQSNKFYIPNANVQDR